MVSVTFDNLKSFTTFETKINCMPMSFVNLSRVQVLLYALSNVASLARYRFTKKRTAIYVGCTDMKNLGDDVVLAAIEKLLAKTFAMVKFSYRHKSWSLSIIRHLTRKPDFILIGGGTIITKGSDESYLKIVNQLSEHCTKARIIVFGAGVADQHLAKATGFPVDTEAWVRLLNRCDAIAVRGPISKMYLESWGVTKTIKICGDPAILYSKGEITRKSKSRKIGINFCNILGRIYGQNNESVESFAAGLVQLLLNDHWDVYLIPTADSDLEYMMDILSPEVSKRTNVIKFRDLKSTIDALEFVDIMIGQRLHSIIFASLVYTPFLAIEYESKTTDYLLSLNLNNLSMRTDQLDKRKAFEQLCAKYQNLDQEQDILFNSVRALKETLRKEAESLSNL